jgi:hypothetical protein
MGVGESIFFHLQTQREALRQYRLGFMPPARDVRPYTITIENGEATVCVVADDFSEHGLMLQSLRVTAAGRGGEAGTADGLRELVDRIVSDVVSPYGGVRCIEQEQRSANAILRTDPDSDGCFFEIVVFGENDVELKHYTVSPRTRERRRTSVNIGRSVFGKLADSFAGAFGDGFAIPQ